MSSAVSPLAPTVVPEMPAIAGVKLATAAAGIRYQGRTDVLLAVLDKGTAVAGVFTQSKCPSAPVEWCRAKLAKGQARALVVNSGNANAFTGKTGRQATTLTASIAAKAVGCSSGEVFLASTGVIGEPLDATKFNGVLGTLAEKAAPGEWVAAAKAIMTTDTFPKVATATIKLGKAKVTINGMAKGAGMIAPDMATMLAFVFTDAPVAAGALQSLLKKEVEDTFNAVIIVEGAVSKASALKIAMSVANSPLVKTAIAGEDANWGRVVMAVGKAGEPADRDKLSIAFNGIQVAKRGARDPSYDEAEVSSAMKQPKIQIKISLGLGKGRDRVLTCDLTKEYVAINGDYRS